MPLYRNECRTCGYRFRTLEASTATGTATCPACGSQESRRLLPRVAVQFKGSGFYRTDHSQRGNGAREEGAPDREPISAASRASDDE